MHELPRLGYSYDALEPYIDAKTMEIHHLKHHQAYVDKLNAALEGHPELQNRPVEELLNGMGSLPESIRTAVKNNGGGHFNHSFFWKGMRLFTKQEGPAVEAITKRFGSLEKFRDELSNAAIGFFGSGWAWLVLNQGKLEIATTQNHDLPPGRPLLTIDVWEHSYYLKYRSRRADYVDSFFSVINWDRVNELFLQAGQG